MAGPQPLGRSGEQIAGIISEGMTGSGIPVTHFRGCPPVFGSAVAELKKALLARNRSSYGNGSSPSRRSRTLLVSGSGYIASIRYACHAWVHCSLLPN
jgi:hypothetical protein